MGEHARTREINNGEIESALVRHHGNVKAVCEELNIERSTLYRRIKSDKALKRLLSIERGRALLSA